MKNYLKMNEEYRGKWSCPLCSKPAYVDDLVEDRFYTMVLECLQGTKTLGVTKSVFVLGMFDWEPQVQDVKRIALQEELEVEYILYHCLQVVIPERIKKMERDLRNRKQRSSHSNMKSLPQGRERLPNSPASDIEHIER